MRSPGKRGGEKGVSKDLVRGKERGRGSPYQDRHDPSGIDSEPRGRQVMFRREGGGKHPRDFFGGRGKRGKGRREAFITLMTRRKLLRVPFRREEPGKTGTIWRRRKKRQKALLTV